MKIPRNEPCPCLSGKKYKKCCDLQDKSSIDQPILNILLKHNEVAQEANKQVQISDFDQKLNWAIEQIEAGNVAQVQEEVDVLMQTYPNHEGVYFMQALCHINDEQIDEAINALKKAIELYPLYSEAYYELGHAYFLQEDIINAVTCLKKVLAIEKLDLQNEALQTAAQQMISSMEKNIKEACDLNLDEYIKYVSLAERAETCFNTSKYKKAAMLFEEALEIAPSISDLYEPLAAAYMHSGQEELARATISRLIMIDPNYLEKFLAKSEEKNEENTDEENVSDAQIVPHLDSEIEL